MDNQPIRTVPLDTYEEKIKEKYAESFVNQSDLMDKWAQQLLTLELAIPGLYATALKLIWGDKAIVMRNAVLYITFAVWLVALALTLVALIPRRWKVNPEILERDPTSTTGELGIKDFFAQSARYKRSLLIIATILFFIGTMLAALGVL